MAKPIEIVIASHGENLGWAGGLESIITEYSTSDRKIDRGQRYSFTSHPNRSNQGASGIDSLIDLLRKATLQAELIKIDIKLKPPNQRKGLDIGDHKVVKIENNTNLCEANHFLVHIINQYDNLADTTIFLQGAPIEHSPSFLADILVNLGSEFCTIPKSHSSILEEKSHGLLAINFADLIGRKTKESCWSAGGQFMASRNAIRKNPIEWYQTVFEKAKEFKDAKFALERLWHVVITGETK